MTVSLAVVPMTSGVAVFDFDDPDTPTLQNLRKTHGIHELAIEAAMEAHHQRPKLERFGAMWFLVLKTVSYDDAAETIDFGELLVMVGDRYVITVRHGGACQLPSTTDMLNSEKASSPMGLRDVEDHVRRVVDRITQANVLLSEILDANLAQISVHQSADMRRMTAWAVLFLIPALLAGVWGMNFSNMPELDWVAGYPIAVGSMVATTGYFWWRLKRAGWL